jgi:hypothetical protein
LENENGWITARSSERSIHRFAKLQEAGKALAGTVTSEGIARANVAVKPGKPGRKRRNLSAAARAKMSAAQKKRRANLRKSAKKTP